MQEYDFYLAGPICHDEKGYDWRERLELALPQFRFFNPLKHGIEGKTGDYREFCNGLRAEADGGNLMTLGKLRSLMRSEVIPSDLAGISACQEGLICYIKKDKRAFGSICEIYEAKMKQGKIVFLISELTYSEMNNWEIALSDYIFFSIEDLIIFLSKLR